MSDDLGFMFFDAFIIKISKGNGFTIYIYNITVGGIKNKEKMRELRMGGITFGGFSAACL